MVKLLSEKLGDIVSSIPSPFEMDVDPTTALKSTSDKQRFSTLAIVVRRK